MVRSRLPAHAVVPNIGTLCVSTAGIRSRVLMDREYRKNDVIDVLTWRGNLCRLRGALLSVGQKRNSIAPTAKERAESRLAHEHRGAGSEPRDRTAFEFGDDLDGRPHAVDHPYGLPGVNIGSRVVARGFGAYEFGDGFRRGGELVLASVPALDERVAQRAPGELLRPRFVLRAIVDVRVDRLRLVAGGDSLLRLRVGAALACEQEGRADPRSGRARGKNGSKTAAGSD